MRDDTTLPWDPAQHLSSQEDMIVYLEAAFEDGHPVIIAAALDDVARAAGREGFVDTVNLDLETLIVRLKSLGFELTAKAA